MGVAEPGIRMFCDVALDLLPIPSVVADLLAPGTDRKQPLKCLPSRQGFIRGGDPAGEFLPQPDDPHADVDARPQLQGYASTPSETSTDSYAGATRAARRRRRVTGSSSAIRIRIGALSIGSRRGTR
jgi:hypothetical protein